MAVSEVELWGYRTKIDLDTTRQWYTGAEAWGCECGDCRHFVSLAQERKLPAPILACLDELGIPAEKATYVCQIVAVADGNLFQFSYRIAGCILEEKPAQKREWGEVRCCHEIYPYGAPGFPPPHFDLEFWIALP